MHRATRTGWHLFVPVGAGLAFLALFGGGGADRNGSPILDAGTVDVMAHLFGLAVGIPLGAIFFAVGMRGGTQGPPYFPGRIIKYSPEKKYWLHFWGGA